MIEATLMVTIELAGRGAPIADPNHVRRWLCADGNPIGITPSGAIEFEVCNKCPDPDDCPEDSDHTVTVYRARITAADWDDEGGSS